jgi:hypothetical protein
MSALWIESFPPAALVGPSPGIEMRIPTQGGQVFRPDRGHPSDVMAATIPI